MYDHGPPHGLDPKAIKRHSKFWWKNRVKTGLNQRYKRKDNSKWEKLEKRVGYYPWSNIFAKRRNWRYWKQQSRQNEIITILWFRKTKTDWRKEKTIWSSTKTRRGRETIKRNAKIERKRLNQTKTWKKITKEKY